MRYFWIFLAFANGVLAGLSFNISAGLGWLTALACMAIEEKLKQRIAVLENVMSQTCEWKEDEDSGAWETECGKMFEIIDGTPLENKMVYCPFCGKVIAGA